MAAVVAAATLMGCSREHGFEQRVDETLDLLAHTQGVRPDVRKDAETIYTRSGEKPVWLNSQRQFTPQALSLLEVLRNSDGWGMRSGSYSVYIESIMRPDPAIQDVSLTAAALILVNDLRFGRANPHKSGKFLPGQSRAEFVYAKLAHGNDVERELRALEPASNAYTQLKLALQTYRQLAAGDQGSLDLPAVTRPIESGDAYENASRLADRLRILGDLPQSGESAGTGKFSVDLADAVRRFQNRHGLQADGRLGKATIDALNTPLEEDVQKIEMTLERMRWPAGSSTGPMIVVNIPEFMLRVMNDTNEVELEMRAIVGKPGSPTPLLSGQVGSLIFNPYWNVPLSIQKNEIVPSLRKDKSYLEKNDYEITDSRGRVVADRGISDGILAKLESGQFLVRQRPGKNNALGSIKFVFPNDHDVYAHDTPARSLFRKDDRALSHGCVRLEKPWALAEWLLADDPTWPPERIAEAKGGSEPVQAQLKHRIPIFLIYETASVTADGEVHFFRDLYGEDAKLAAQMEESQPQVTSGVLGRRPRE